MLRRTFNNTSTLPLLSISKLYQLKTIYCLFFVKEVYKEESSETFTHGPLANENL